MLQLNHTYVTSIGKLVGVVALKDVRAKMTHKKNKTVDNNNGKDERRCSYEGRWWWPNQVVCWYNVFILFVLSFSSQIRVALEKLNSGTFQSSRETRFSFSSKDSPEDQAYMSESDDESGKMMMPGRGEQPRIRLERMWRQRYESGKQNLSPLEVNCSFFPSLYLLSQEQLHRRTEYAFTVFLQRQRHHLSPQRKEYTI